MADRWERERAAYILAGAHRRAGARRRGERLMAAARRQDRSRAGVGDTAYAATVTPSLPRRFITRGEGASSVVVRVGLLAVGAVVLALAIGPGMLLARLIYAVQWWRAPSWGPMRHWTWLVAQVLVTTSAVVVWQLWDLSGQDMLLTALKLWLTAQVMFVPLLVADLIVKGGWACVPAASRTQERVVARAAEGKTKTTTEVAQGGDAEDTASEDTPEPRTSGMRSFTVATGSEKPARATTSKEKQS